MAELDGANAAEYKRLIAKFVPTDAELDEDWQKMIKNLVCYLSKLRFY